MTTKVKVIKEHPNTKDLLSNMMDNLEWEFPNTWLEQLKNFD